jgi:Obg family GTPase CgtA
MFIDEAKIRVKAGGGGNGCVAFRREKYVPRGGPSGGDGGKGGDIYMESSERHNTLVHFRFNPEYKAQRGRHGEGANKTGREGEDIILKVPVGTILYDDETGEKIHDFSQPDAATPGLRLPRIRLLASTKTAVQERSAFIAWNSSCSPMWDWSDIPTLANPL